MKILMITRKVDRLDHLAGFTYGWVQNLARQVSELYVVCLQSGDISGLPDNVKVFGLNAGRRWLRFFRFYKIIFKLVPKVDGIFCHMNPEYTIAVAPAAKLFRKKIVSWYTHGTVSFKTKLLARLADVILTASKDSFRLSSPKVKVVGHGIDLVRFKPVTDISDKKEVFQLLSVGRISPTKDYESMIKAVDILVGQGTRDIKLTLIGDVGLADQAVYLSNLKEMVKKMNLSNQVFFRGSAPNIEIPAYLQSADVFINLSGTGSLDKAVLEAMACGALILTSNEAFKHIVPPELLVSQNNPSALAEKINWLKSLSPDIKADYRRQLIEVVRKNHNLEILAQKIKAQFD